MAVYTQVSADEAQALCEQFGLGNFVALDPIKGGIENSNFFLSAQVDGEPVVRRVLTLFERLSAAQLPYYLDLMGHLAAHGIAVPDPVVRSGPVAKGAHRSVIQVSNKPASVVSCLEGQSELTPSVAHCSQLGQTLARMHLAGASFGLHQPNLRALAWWNDTAPTVMPHLESAQVALLSSELAYQNHVATTSSYSALPKGAIHADLFRDNVMFTTGEDGHPVLSGVFDFYFAGDDHWLFDLCVALNDWAIDLATGELDRARARALLGAYQAVRPLTAAERELFNAMLRAAALRFWISRLWDWHKPRVAKMLQPHDPTHFERVLRLRARCATLWLMET